MPLIRSRATLRAGGYETHSEELQLILPIRSVYAGSLVDVVAEIASIESQGRYITRPTLAMDAPQEIGDGRLMMETAPDPPLGATSIELSPLEWI
jgi:hypothetical protein